MIHRLSPQAISLFIAGTHPQSRSTSRALSTKCIHRFFSRNTRGRPVSRNGIADKRLLHASAPNFAASRDPYQVLGLQKDASSAEIKKVYFSLARKYHPDTNPDKGARDKFVEIQDAYDVLKDDKKRALYDKYGAASQQPGFDPDAQGPFGTGAGGFSGFQGFAGAGFGAGGGRGQADLFEQLFGGAFGGRSRGRASGFGENTRGDDIEASVGVSFLEACKGAVRNINITPVVNCGTCSGSGLKTGAKRSSCTSCGGTGTRTFVIDSGFQMASTCPTCSGTGTTIPRGSQCGECAGMGKVRVRKTVKVDIPPGVEDGMSIRVPNAGDASISEKGGTGDLLVRVNVSSSKVFRRQGANLHHDAKIPWHTAVLGGRVRVPTLDGDVDVRMPAGTQQGEEMVLKGRGVSPLYVGEKGDLFVAFSIQLPRSLTKRQREILQLYVDDLEGRTTVQSQPSPASPSPEPISDESRSNNEESQKDTAPHDNEEQATDRTNQAAQDDNADAERSQKKRATA